jgi:hypothetical protein
MTTPKIDGTRPVIFICTQTHQAAKMSSWKQKLASKIDNNVPAAATLTTQTTTQPTTGSGGWKQRISDKKEVPSNPLPKVNINDINDFPSLSSAPLPTKKAKLTNYVGLAKEWAEHSREEQARADAEKTQREMQEFSFNYNAMSALDKLNYTLYSYSMLDTPREYDHEKDTDSQCDES